MRVPAGLATSRRPRRSNSGAPSRCSSRSSRWLSAGWLTYEVVGRGGQRLVLIERFEQLEVTDVDIHNVSLH